MEGTRMSSDAKAATSYEEGLKGASESVAEFKEKNPRWPGCSIGCT
jgi:hypothetical protein